MLKIHYKEWVDLCNNLEKYIKINRTFYFQLYFFTEKTIEKIKDEKYFNKYIKTGAFLWNDLNWIKCENPNMNSDGSLRQRNLISPLFYVIYVYIGKKISKLYKNKRYNNIETYYAGNFDEDIYHYKREYNKFCNKAIKLSKEYSYYIKTDIKNFFNNVNIDLLFYNISTNINSKELKISLQELNFMKEFIKFIGDGRLPQIEEGITSSYFATKIYLEEIDNRLYNYLKNNNIIENFKIIRYVDDLYIFFNIDNDTDKEYFYEDTINFLSDVIYEYGININISKTEMKDSCKIESDLKHVSYLDELYIKENINEIINYSDLENILKDIYSEDNITRRKYNEILKKRLGNIDIYTENELFNSIIYTNNSIISNEYIIRILKLLIDERFDFVYCDPKRITILIAKTKDEETIKMFLNKLFVKQRKGGWNRYDKIAVEQYLLQRQFINKDLIYNLNGINNLNMYIKKFINVDWTENCFSTIEKKLCQDIENYKDTRYFELYAYYKFEEDKGNYELKLSYFKSYFEAITTILNSKKINQTPIYGRTYSETSLRKSYIKIIGNELYNNDIHQICQLRNNNMVNHSGGDKREGNIHKEIDQNIERIKKLIKEAIRKI